MASSEARTQLRNLESRFGNSSFDRAIPGAGDSQPVAVVVRVPDVVRSRQAGSESREQARSLNMQVRNLKFRPRYYICWSQPSWSHVSDVVR